MLSNFSYVIPDKLAGCGRPGGAADLQALRNEGITALVSLTVIPPEPELVASADLKHLHLPVMDFTAPSAEAIDECISFVKNSTESGAVAIHCGAGYGRTGTMLACCLVAEDIPAEEAIRRIRLLRPGSIETMEQELSVHMYADQLKDR